MGCCISVPSHEASVDKKEKACFSLESRAPPPAEEETVKEVLSEIPKPRHDLPVMLIGGGDVKKEVEETKDLTKTVFSKIQENKNDHLQDRREEVVEKESVKRQEVETNEETMSEASEICSLTMSESVSTTTVRSVADGRDEGGDGEVRQRQRQRVSRSPAKLPARNRLVGQSPLRRSEQSPGKRSLNNGSVRFVQGSSREESGQSTTTVRRGGSMPEPRRRDPGESSGRRSRSPAITRSATLNRSPSTRRTAQSPGRVRTDPNESGSRRMEGKWAINQNQNNNNNNINNNNKNNSSTNESLENPLVSLECFIFL